MTLHVDSRWWQEDFVDTRHEAITRVVRAIRQAQEYRKVEDLLHASMYSNRPLGGFGLDLDRIRSDMNAPEISRRMERDMADARALGVTRTPELFVNGRQMQNLSLDEFHALVREELRKSYP